MNNLERFVAVNVAIAAAGAIYYAHTLVVEKLKRKHIEKIGDVTTVLDETGVVKNASLSDQTKIFKVLHDASYI